VPNDQPKPALPGPSRLPRAARIAGLVLAVMTGVAVGAGPTAPLPPRPPAPTAADCQHLLHQFDVAWPAHRSAPRGAAAQHSRDLGDGECRAGHYAEGVRLLRRALHDIGVKPVRIVPSSPVR